jgi:luciferase family oxidoreductase group 1
MDYRLSLLDKSPLQRGEEAKDALARTVALAQQAERSGFHRFWLAEHHGMRGLASSAPEVLIAYVLARTSRIRVGSGGVMLQHYSPYKVAETFNLLATLAPGRVDLGVGKAPGGFPHSTRALQWGQDPALAPGFSERLAALDAFLLRRSDAVATPIPPEPPERFLLGASVESAALAAEHGWTFVFAGQFNGDEDLIERSFAAYTRAGGRSPILAVAAFVAATQSLAEEKVAGLRVFKVSLGDGQRVNLGSPEQAAEFARQAGVADYGIEETKPSVLAGTPDVVLRALDRLHERWGVGEIVIDTPVPTEAERLASIELLGREAFTVPALAS